MLECQEKRNNIKKEGTSPCSSCGLCVVSCPFQALRLEKSSDGFFEPVVDNNKCIDCGICCKVCYKYLELNLTFKNTFEDKTIYAAWSKDKKVVRSSSSGGVGYELTRYFFEKDFNVVGVVFNAEKNCCEHIIANNESDLKLIQSSKYLQSNTTIAFSNFKKNEKYLVIGTPCQIYGLRKWIQMKKIEENFILIDFFCHGTPSYNLWEKYKKHLEKEKNLNNKLKQVYFRNKHKSTWHNYYMYVEDSKGNVYNTDRREDLFFKFFLNDSCLNKACYSCQLRLDNCESDIRLADFWGPKYTQNVDGVSMVIPNTKKGVDVLKEIENLLIIEECSYEDLKQSQGKRYLKGNPKRDIIIEELRGDKSLSYIYRKHLKKSIITRGISYSKYILKKVIN